MSAPDFIETYPDALSPAACAALIKRFEASGRATPGQPGDQVSDKKLSRDLAISGEQEWLDADAELNEAMLRGLMAYLRKYPHTILGALSFHHPDSPAGQPRNMTGDDLAAMDDVRLTQLVRQVLRPGPIILEHYAADVGHFHWWHSEQTPADPRAEQLHRVLQWTIYLNEGFEEGETEFLHQKRKIAPRTGTLLIAPAAFTHTHRANVPRGGDKYVASSWVLYKRFDALFGNPQ
jgi:hypothetical protein